MRTLSAVAIATILVAAPIRAQGYPQTRSGFTISFGFGSGSATFDCEGCDTRSQNGGTAYLRLGGTVRPNLIVAGEINGWTKSQNDATLSVSSLNLLGQWYPNLTGGFYLEAGIGGGSVTAAYAFGGGSTLTQTQSGVSYQFGAGYDWRVGRNFSLTPYGKYFIVNTGDSGYGSNDQFNAKVFHLGIGFTWH